MCNQMQLIKMAFGPLHTCFGKFNIELFSDGKNQCLVLSMGMLKNESNVYCRFESLCITGHIFKSIECECHEQLLTAQKIIASQGKGLIILLLDHEGCGNGIVAHIESQKLKGMGFNQDDAYECLGYEKDSRDFRIAAKVIKYLCIDSVLFSSNNKNKIDTLKLFDINYFIYSED